MEICLDEAIPTYSGGLGVLAGDTLRSAADLGAPVVAVTLLHRKGYFSQHLDPAGAQTEKAVSWNPDDQLDELPARATVEIEGRTVVVRAWKFTVQGVGGHQVPVYLLGNHLPDVSGVDRAVVDKLYVAV